MRYLRVLTLAVLVLLGVVALAARDGARPVRVLFIGNSYVYVNDLPRMIEALAVAGKQPRFRHESETPGGCTLEKHWKDGRAVAKIARGGWDYVVLQEQSTRPLPGSPAIGKDGVAAAWDPLTSSLFVIVRTTAARAQVAQGRVTRAS